MVGMLGRWVDGEKEELDLVPSGCCDWPSCYDPRTQVGLLSKKHFQCWSNIQALPPRLANTHAVPPRFELFSSAWMPVAHCGLSAPPSWSSLAATASTKHELWEMCWSLRKKPLRFIDHEAYLNYICTIFLQSNLSSFQVHVSLWSTASPVLSWRTSSSWSYPGQRISWDRGAGAWIAQTVNKDDLNIFSYHYLVIIMGRCERKSTSWWMWSPATIALASVAPEMGDPPEFCLIVNSLDFTWFGRPAWTLFDCELVLK